MSVVDVSKTDENVEKLEKVLTLICKELVDLSDEVKINVTRGNRATIFEIKVDDSDIGKIIGFRGRNIYSLRNIINSISKKYQLCSSIEVAENRS